MSAFLVVSFRGLALDSQRTGSLSYGGEVSYFLRVDFWQRGLAFVLIYSWIDLDFVIGLNASILGNWAARISGIYR
ncbi:hypothetical protein [Microcoleus sp.]|uniref:hypothetical protein n=1 Tax=Microcoleus sp. TaxID=44472 RepID=UPI00403EB421